MRAGRSPTAVKAVAAVALTLVLAVLAVYVVWSDPGQVSGSLTEVSPNVAH